ncbi:chromosome partitioning protein ParA [Halieaceae bacterium IMCC14734]|uniref:Chromosome partitioning protein ParA n=1 Tax=Candidatus Litorirhabdus singularis TaxID=2518993 RepID=A0ABT3TJY8_9GAMM|nr:AAA family ATPase [Candidatus Litorirhabdus singularis]MCX2981734.1 chromosome partitioning protein ParA [Candidatus Litorirhabdus singularis]
MKVIVCPKCTRKHKVNAASLPQAEMVFARCRACSHKFPVQLDQLRRTEVGVSSPQSGAGRARKICVTLSKGGVGKTTTAVHVSAALAESGKRVLLVDTDTQGQAAYMLGLKPKAGLTELLTGELTAEDAITPARDNLWLLAGGRSLAGAKRIIDKKSFGSEHTLAEALAGIDRQFDFIIIDTSPGWDQLTVNVLFYADEIMIPVALEVMPLHGLSEFSKSLQAIQQYRKDLRISYIVPTFMDNRVQHPQEIFQKLVDAYGTKISKPIHYDERFSHAPSYGKTIFEYAPESRGAADYRDLVTRIVCEKMAA